MNVLSSGIFASKAVETAVWLPHFSMERLSAQCNRGPRLGSRADSRAVHRAPHGALCPCRSRQTLRTSAFMEPSSGAVDALKLVSQLVTTVGLTAGALWVGREILLDQEKAETTSSSRSCPRCSGSGYEPCMCTKWSDGDVGCTSCQHSGFMKCRSCGGGGKGIPIPVTVTKRNI